MQKASNITNKTPWKGANNNLDFGDNGVDAAGHLVQEDGKKVYRAQDIWKFNPDEYKQKWSSYDLDSKAVLGLKILDKLGTPVIVRTPWLLLTMIQYMIIGMKMGMVEENQIKSLLKLILIKLIVSIGLG